MRKAQFHFVESLIVRTSPLCFPTWKMPVIFLTQNNFLLTWYLTSDCPFPEPPEIKKFPKTRPTWRHLALSQVWTCTSNTWRSSCRLLLSSPTSILHENCPQITACCMNYLVSFNNINPIRPGVGGGGGGSSRSNFNLRELPCYLNNTYETLPLLLNFIEGQDSGFFCCCLSRV